MTELTFRQALNQALREEMMRDSSVYLLGIAVGGYRQGGVFGVSEGLLQQFGPNRVIETPISEGAIIGTSVGAALMGMRPVAEIMDAEFLAACFHQVVYEAAQMRFFTNGASKVPLVVRAAFGAATDGVTNQQRSVESWYLTAPGIKIVLPSTPADAKGLLKAAIRDDDPVLFLEHKALYECKGEVPEGDWVIPLGKADVKRRGRDVTVVATGRVVGEALSAARALSAAGIELEVVDPRTLLPLDKETILASARKTHRVIVAHEGTRTGGAGAEIASLVAEEAFGDLRAPVLRLAAPDLPVSCVPNQDDIVRAVRGIMHKESGRG